MVPFVDVFHRRRLVQNVEARKSLGTTTQQADLQEHCLHIEKRIAAFRTIQAAYSPEVACFLAAHPLSDELESNPESQPLYLPSRYPPSVSVANVRIADMESKLRYAQASDAIVELRQSLTVSLVT
jgi:hypothetical protein